MQDNEAPGREAFLSRSDVELELARIALVVMRSSPQAYGGTPLPPGEGGVDGLPALCNGLLARAAPEHRPFVQGRLLELARSLSGGRADAGHEWLDVSFELPMGAHAPSAPAPKA